MDNYCKICYEKIKFDFLRSIIEPKIEICSNCLNQIKVDITSLNINGIKIKFLSTYDFLLKRLLINFKENLDYELRNTILYLFLPYIRLYSINYHIVLVPSSKKNISRRGYLHLNEILESHKIKYYDILENNEEDIQKNLHISKRINQKSISLKKDAYQLQNKNIILFDDVYTSGSTFLSSVSEIKKISPKKIKGLILMRNTYVFN